MGATCLSDGLVLGLRRAVSSLSVVARALIVNVSASEFLFCTTREHPILQHFANEAEQETRRRLRIPSEALAVRVTRRQPKDGTIYWVIDLIARVVRDGLQSGFLFLFYHVKRSRRGSVPTVAHHQRWNVYDLEKSTHTAEERGNHSFHP